MMICDGLYSSWFSRLNLLDTAALSSAIPSTAVYFDDLPSRIALIAASLMFSGVSKSGSPAPSPMTSRPASFSARALSVTAMVADGLMRMIWSAMKAIVRFLLVSRRLLPKAPIKHRQAPNPGTSSNLRHPDQGWRRRNAPLRPDGPNIGQDKRKTDKRHGPGASGVAERRVAHPRTHPHGRGRGPDRLGCRLPLSGGDRHWRRRPARPADRNRFLQRLCGRHLRAGGQLPSTVRFGAAIRSRASHLRRGDAILRLALSALLSLRRRRFGVDALRPGAVRLAGSYARALSAGDPRHPESFPPARRGESDCGSALAPPRPRLPGSADQCRARP